MSETPVNFDRDDVLRYCEPLNAGKQALQRIRMEHRYGMGPFTARADREATIGVSLAYIDAYWGAWGEAYLTGVLAQFGVRHPRKVTDRLDGLRTSTPSLEDIADTTFAEADG